MGSRGSSLNGSQEIGDPLLRGTTLAQAAYVFLWRGEVDRSLALCREAADLAEREHVGLVLGLAAFAAGHSALAKGDYEEALRWYRRLSDYASTAGDKLWIARVPNVMGGVHLELFDLDEARQLCVEGDEIAQKVFPWPEPRGHSLLKAGLAHLYQGEHGRAEDFFQRAWALLEVDEWLRWRWQIPLLRARGELALIEGRHDEAWSFAHESLALAERTDSRKHVSRAQHLQGEILAASGRIDEAVPVLRAAVDLARHLGTPREVWIGSAALGRVLARLGRDKDAEVSFARAADAIEEIAGKLVTPRLRRSFLSAEPVRDVYRASGRRAPDP